jgi:Uma2 family endonuclease
VVDTGVLPAVGEAGMDMTPAEYERIALAEPDRRWELHLGRLREKPGMSVSHNRVTIRLGKQLLMQLDEREFEVRIDQSRVRRDERTYYIPDLIVVPAGMVATIEDRPGVLESYRAPLALVVEVWSPSTGDYDVEDKLPEYQRRGDIEIWRIHPYERNVTVYRRRPDGGCDVSVHADGKLYPVALPGVVVELNELFRSL